MLDRHSETVAWRRSVAALLGLLAVALGAFGAHALRGRLVALGTVEIWNTASLYHLMHAVVLLCIALALPTARRAYAFILIGVLLFSGSLYVYAVTRAAFVPLFTPVGGVALMLGWLMLVLPDGSKRPAKPKGENDA